MKRIPIIQLAALVCILAMLAVVAGCRTGFAVKPALAVASEADVRHVNLGTYMYVEHMDMYFGKEVPFDIARGAKAAVGPAAEISGEGGTGGNGEKPMEPKKVETPATPPGDKEGTAKAPAEGTGDEGNDDEDTGGEGPSDDGTGGEGPGDDGNDDTTNADGTAEGD